ncbi:phosphodiester glycosidase family protein [Rhizobium sp. AC27/96]|uniref:phosphodiester glycosidase family protein n=1 Tax=Rhizobium sp. AC27/96 TaxID=1841653 RepID=UPI0018E956E8|nr:phosphodiester glycosidase family protein [Rhizobium sp. AC27/96]
MIILTVLAFAATASAGEACRKVQHLGDGYTVCIFDPTADDIQLYQNDRSGKPYGSFRALENDLRLDRTYVRFAMNGGMYLDDQSPVGLFVQNGRELKAINTNKGWGNFHLLPNGVFYLLPGRAGVMESRAFVASGIKPFYATQSGPMLVIDGALHPSFLADSTSLKSRNGVGVTGDGKVVFAVSDGPVRFHDFATLFRDDLDCANALFLDGSISSLDIPEWQRRDGLFPLGPIIAVTELLPG